MVYTHVFVGMDTTYTDLFTSVHLVNSTHRTKVDLRHYPDGPTLNVECQEFFPTHPNQIRVLQQNSSGWHFVKTTAYFLATTKIDISSYVKGCVGYALREACALRTTPIVYFFILAQHYIEVSNLQRCRS